MTFGLTLTIHRGTHQIGGVAAELSAGDERVIIDLGANLPGSDAAISDDELVGRVFNGRPCTAVLFTHCHGDHVGLFRRIPAGTCAFIGPTAKKIMKIVAEYTDKDSLPQIERMETYNRGHAINGFRDMRIVPFSVDHSAPDSYMLYIEAAGKRVLFTGDFRAHGIANERCQLRRVLEKYIPSGIDLLVTEGTLLSRTGEIRANPVRTERELGERAREIFAAHKYNFVLVSSTNLDSVMEFYHAAPKDKLFICDMYQARVMLTAMEAARREFPQYRAGHRIFLTGGRIDHALMEDLIERGRGIGLMFGRANLNKEDNLNEMRERGFVMLVRPNRHGGLNTFERALEKFYDEAFITYSMWTGYLRGGICEDADIVRYMGETPFEVLHTSGHAFPEDIAGVFQAVEPKLIVPMHTEMADEFSSFEPFAPWADRVRVLSDGEALTI